MKPEAVDTIRRAGDRRRAGTTAPPHGLFLVKVAY
jgi:tRNA U38,U39,U40 pseudouridine synthase TruA